MIRLPKYLILCLIGTLVLMQCSKKKSELAWETKLYTIGSQSSPRAADLNKDGIKDIVIGAAQNENQHTDQGVLAIDGQSGKVLWKQEAEDQVFGSATFYDITDDDIPDVFIGGRSPHFRALDGSNGQVLWEYQFQHQDDSILQHARFNFYNSVLIPDQNQNDYPELLTVNGGNVKALPYNTEERYPGVMMVFDSKTGTILAADTMPDGRETYLSPVCFAQPGGEDYQIIFGTGGETISGNLYQSSLSDLMSTGLSNAKVLASETGHGFIAPPSIADITGDGFYDIVAISHASTVFAIDGKTAKTYWETTIPGTESSNSFAVGYFNKDDIPDFFTFVSKGVWPNSTAAVQVMLDGKNGTIGFQDSMGCVTFSSPVAYDLNKDGIDEAILSYHDFNCYRDSTDLSNLDIETFLVAINFSDNSVIPIDRKKRFKNVFATPWIGDLDNDGYLDIVNSQCYSPNANLLSFLGMNVRRISTNIRMNKKPAWGGYMGVNGDGVFPMEKD